MYVSIQLTQIASTSLLCVVIPGQRCLSTTTSAPCSFALWYNPYLPACLIAPRLSCVHALRMCSRYSYDRNSVLSLLSRYNNPYCRLKRLGVVSMSALTCSKLCHVTLLEKCLLKTKYGKATGVRSPRFGKIPWIC